MHIEQWACTTIIIRESPVQPQSGGSSHKNQKPKFGFFSPLSALSPCPSFLYFFLKVPPLKILDRPFFQVYTSSREGRRKWVGGGQVIFLLCKKKAAHTSHITRVGGGNSRRDVNETRARSRVRPGSADLLHNLLYFMDRNVRLYVKVIKIQQQIHDIR